MTSKTNLNFNVGPGKWRVKNRTREREVLCFSLFNCALGFQKPVAPVKLFCCLGRKIFAKFIDLLLHGRYSLGAQNCSHASFNLYVFKPEKKANKLEKLLPSILNFVFVCSIVKIFFRCKTKKQIESPFFKI